MSAALPLNFTGDARSVDYFRCADPYVAGGSPRKEWQHFLVFGEDFDLLVNFNLLDDAWQRDAPEVGRVIVIARGGSQWHGGVDRVETQALRVSPGRLDAEFGDSRLAYQDGAYRVSVALRDRPITAELVFTPRSNAAVLRNFPIAPGRTFSWAFVPRLVTTGFVDIGGERRTIDGALAYHDHNWGAFRWSDDFAWEWGSAVPARAEDPWSAVMVRATDRGRRLIRCQLFALWRGQDAARIFHDEDLAVRTSGRFEVHQPLQVPRVMALLAGGDAWDVPASYEIDAANGRDWLRYRFRTESLSQVLVPDDGSVEGITALCEVIGQVALTGRVAGEDVTMTGRGVLELIR